MSWPQFRHFWHFFGFVHNEHLTLSSVSPWIANPDWMTASESRDEWGKNDKIDWSPDNGLVFGWGESTGDSVSRSKRILRVVQDAYNCSRK